MEESQILGYLTKCACAYKAKKKIAVFPLTGPKKVGSIDR